MIEFVGGIIICLLILVVSVIYYFRKNPFARPSEAKKHENWNSNFSNLYYNSLSAENGSDFVVHNNSCKEPQVKHPISMKHVESQTNLTEDFKPLWLEKGAHQHQVKEEEVQVLEENGQKDSSGKVLELENFLRENPEDGLKQLSEEDILLLLKFRKIRAHQLEKDLGDELKAVHIRRKWLTDLAFQDQRLASIPYFNYDYSFVSNSCCENVIGYVPLPLGYVGPLTVNSRKFFVPMATTEGCLVASVNRGCRALEAGGGVRASVKDFGMSRGPVVMFERAEEALEMKLWIEKENNMRLIKPKFDMTSRFAKLKGIKCNVAGRLLFMRFVATTGDAMGMNMVSKATSHILKILREQYFPRMRVISLSGNFCVDKKPAALNWIEGRGKLVVCDAIVPKNKVREILKSDVESLVELNIAKNLVGSAVSGSLGGFNAHSANVVTAIFLATGQDVAEAVSSSNCMTQLEKQGEDLYVSCTLPSLEVGTVGGGTILPPQSACLEMLGVSGGSSENPGENAMQLARVIGATVLAGEVSLLAALNSGDLVRSHLKYNRSSINLKKMTEYGEGGASSTLAQKSMSFGDFTRELGQLAENVVKEGLIEPDSCSQVLT